MSARPKACQAPSWTSSVLRRSARRSSSSWISARVARITWPALSHSAWRRSRAEGFLSQLRRAGIIDDRNVNQYTLRGNSKRLNEDGKALVERVLVGRVVGDPDLLSETPASMVSALARAVPYMAQAEAAGAGYGLREELKAALDAYNDMTVVKGMGVKLKKDYDQGVREYLAHRALIEQDGKLIQADHPLLSNQRARALLSVLVKHGGPNQMAAVFRQYAKQAKANPEGQDDLFGGKSPAQVFRESIDLAVSGEARRAADDARGSGDGGQGGLFAASLTHALRGRVSWYA